MHSPFHTINGTFSWKRLICLSIISLVTASGVYGFLEYRSLSNSIFVKGAGRDAGLLSYDASKASSLDWSKFQQPGDGRFNLLVLGIGGINDSGVAHDGTLLTDSIQVLSVDTINHKVGLTSVPRDFYINIPGHGPNKINAVYEFGEMDQAGQGGEAAKQAFGKVLGINITNFAVIDFTAAKDIVNTVGGIDINVPKSLYDPAFPCDNDVDYCPFSISAGEQHMDGSTALKYMRTRHVDSDFGRSQRQQLVMEATKKKALSVGILTNPVKVVSILDSLGRHVKTDLQPDQVKSLASLLKDINSSEISNNVLSTDESQGLLTSDSSTVAGYTEYPVGGYTAYGPIQQWFQKNNPDPLLAKEAATVAITSRDTTSTQFQSYVTKLKDYGFQVQVFPTPLDLGTYTSLQLYAKDTSAKPVTNHYLAFVAGVTPQSGSPLNSGADFEIIYTAHAATKIKKTY